MKKNAVNHPIKMIPGLKGFGQPARLDNSDSTKMMSFKKGGKVKKTGVAKVHKGEHVIPKHKVKKVKKILNRFGVKM